MITSLISFTYKICLVIMWLTQDNIIIWFKQNIPKTNKTVFLSYIQASVPLSTD